MWSSANISCASAHSIDYFGNVVRFVTAKDRCARAGGGDGLVPVCLIITPM